MSVFNDEFISKKGIKTFEQTKILRQYLNYLNITNFEFYIAGGCFKDIFNNKPFKDIDIFFKNENDYNEMNRLFSNNHRFYEGLETSNCKRYLFSKSFKDENVNFELISTIYGEPDDILNNFDFTVCKFLMHFTYDDNSIPKITFIYHEDYFKDLHLNQLIIDNEVNNPMSIMSRVIKYTKYGFNIDKNSKIKLIKELTKFNDEDVERFSERLDEIDMY